MGKTTNTHQGDILSSLHRSINAPRADTHQDPYGVQEAAVGAETPVLPAGRVVVGHGAFHPGTNEHLLQADPEARARRLVLGPQPHQAIDGVI